MWKKLLLTTALLSSIYGADTQYFDPEFSLLANRSETLVVDAKGVVINLDTPETWILRRLTQAEVSKVLNSNDFDVLADARSSYNEDIGVIQMIYVALTADSTPNNGISKALDDAFLCQLFWSRVSLFEQTLWRLIDLSSQNTTLDPTGALKEHQEKLAVFSMAYDHTDTTLFAKGHSEKLNQLMNEFRETSNVQQSTLSTDE